mmetsp:Transcript_7359/g.16746  ORF Transcript_7359/g.16746 Transcript_7359/m.16746 type:complete len:216 (+) Transcript_7359:51-698(+)
MRAEQGLIVHSKSCQGEALPCTHHAARHAVQGLRPLAQHGRKGTLQAPPCLTACRQTTHELVENLLLGRAQHGKLRLCVATPEELLQVASHDVRAEVRVLLLNVCPQSREEGRQVVRLNGRLAEQAVGELWRHSLPDIPRQHVWVPLHGVEVPQELEGVLRTARGNAWGSHCPRRKRPPGSCSTAGRGLRCFGGGSWRRTWRGTSRICRFNKGSA